MMVASTLRDAFDDFEAAGHETRRWVEQTDRFQRRPIYRPLAYLSLAEARAMAYTLAVVPRLDHPRIHGQTSWHSVIFSLGGPNCQDYRYGATLLDGHQTYRLRGRVGDLKLALFQVQSHIMGHPSSKEVSNTDLLDLARPDGSFDVFVGSPPGSGDEPYIALDPDSSLNFVVVRRILGSIADDPGEMRLVRSGATAPNLETDEDGMAERIHRAADLMRFMVKDWAIGLYDFYISAAGGKNRFAHIHGEKLADDVLGSPSGVYGLGIFDLEPGEALLLEWDPPESAYWSFQLGDVWSNALDFFNYQTDIGMASASIDGDGRVRAVVSAEDPGVANWLDTRGQPEGMVIMRNYRHRTEPVAPTIEKVRIDDLRRHLPADTVWLSPTEREAALQARQTSFLDAFGE